MASPSGATTLSAAANALKSAGSGIPINKQIDTVSNALTGTQRKREMTSQEKGYPREAKNVLEILIIQISEAVNSLSENEQAELLYNQLVEDLEIIEDFANRIMKFYQPKEEDLTSSDKELKTSVIHSLAKAKSEVVSTLALEKIFRKINNLENRYRNNLNMTCNEYRQKLEELSVKVRKWEDELLPGDPMLQDSQTIAERVYRLKTKLHEAFEISNLQNHPAVIGKMGLDILRLSAEMVQHAKNQFEIEQGVLMAIDANRNLRRSGQQFQEKGRTFNLLIQQSIAVFVNRQIFKLEFELRNPLYFVPGDEEKNENVANRLINQMERLITYFELVNKWAGPHQEDLLERIALVYEKIVERAKKAKYLILDEACSKGTSEEQALSKAKVAAKYRRAETLGRDIINPNQIFNERTDLKDEIQELLDRIPDPISRIEHTIPDDKLGRVYHEILTYFEQEDLNFEYKQKLQTALNRIEYYAMRQKIEIDIYDEMAVRSEYMKDVMEQEVARFMTLLGMDPAVTNPKRYAKHTDPSEYPFKGSQLVKVINNYRVVDNFLQGRYGEINQHPTLKTVSKGLYRELEEYSEKVLIEMIKRLKLHITRLPILDEIESILAARIQGLPEEVQSHVKSLIHRVEATENGLALTEEKRQEAIDLQELWLMLEYLKYPQRMKQIEKVDSMTKDELISTTRKLVDETEDELLEDYFQQIKQDLKVDIVELPLTEEMLEKLSDEQDSRRILKRFIQLQNPKMKNIEPFSDQLLEQCRVHKKVSETIIVPLAIKNPKMIQKLVVESLDMVLKDSVRITFELHPGTITKINQENQFYKDHQVVESLPLYVYGLMEQREPDEDVHNRMLTLVENDEEFAEKIESLATQSMFSSPLKRIQGLVTVLSTVLGVSNIKVNLDECTLFLSLNEEKNECSLEGFGLLVVQGPLPETGQIDEIGSIIMKVKVKVTKDKDHNAKISFIDQSYNAFITGYREGQIWNLL